MFPTLAMLSEWHIVLALIILLLLFGGKKLPELARGLGEAIKEYTKSRRDITTDNVCKPASLLTQAEPPTKPTPVPSNPQKPDDSKLN